MKELSPDKFHLQAKMQEWLEANREIYTDFKSKIQSILKNLLCDNHSKQIDDETNKLQSIILEIITTEEGAAADKMIDKFSNAIKDGNVAEYAENEQAYPKPVCGYALKGKRGIQTSHRCDYPFRHGAAQVILRPVRSRRHQERDAGVQRDAGVRRNDRTAEIYR